VADKKFKMSICEKTRAAVQLLKMRWEEDIDSADDVHYYMTKLIEALNKEYIEFVEEKE